MKGRPGDRYETAAGPVLHADLYRIADEREIEDLGVLDRPDGIVLVEWPERAPGLSAPATGEVALSMPSAGGREASVTFRDGRRF